MSKQLIVYFSRKGNNHVRGKLENLSKGNTEAAAELIQKLTNADIFKIEPVVPYSDDYTKCTKEAKRDKDLDKRPEFKNPLKDISKYDVIYVGYPNYWSSMPMIVWTFLEKYNFDGKIIKPFCTHEGGYLGKSIDDIKRLCKNADVKPGLALYGADVKKSEDLIKNWII